MVWPVVDRLMVDRFVVDRLVVGLDVGIMSVENLVVRIVM